MKIRLAKTAGFCMGVRRAMEIAVEAGAGRGAERGQIQSLGPLVHNPQAVELLAAKGVTVADTPPRCGVAIIRAHGVPPTTRAELDEHGVEVIDATCPHVVASQRRIAKHSAEGRAVILVGDADHPEVKGLVGFARTPVHLIASEGEAESLAVAGPVMVIAQTTFQRDGYDRIQAILRRRFPDALYFDSICAATEERQAEARALARACDVLVVVGGRGSANTRRLAEIGAEEGTPTVLVETAEELDPRIFVGAASVGVTAGASTPGWMTQAVLDRIENCAPSTLSSLAWNGLSVLCRARVLTALGALALLFAMARLTGADPIPPLLYAVVALTIFVAYTFNRRTAPDRRVNGLLPVDSFFRSHRATLLVAAGLAFAGSLTLAAQLGRGCLLLVLGIHALSLLYAIPVLPRRFAQRRLKDAPGSKDLLVAAAWTATLVGGMACAGAELSWRRALAAAALTFLLCFAKTLLLDLRDLEGDRLIGIETLPILLGRRRVLWLLTGVHLLILGLTLYLTVWLDDSRRPYGLLFLGTPLYGLVALALLTRRQFRGEVAAQALADGQLLLPGALALAWTLGTCCLEGGV